MDRLFIVVYRREQLERWKAMNDGEFAERRLAENFIECKRMTGWAAWDFAIVEGSIHRVENEAEVTARLGAF